MVFCGNQLVWHTVSVSYPIDRVDRTGGSAFARNIEIDEDTLDDAVSYLVFR